MCTPASEKYIARRFTPRRSNPVGGEFEDIWTHYLATSQKLAKNHNYITAPICKELLSVAFSLSCFGLLESYGKEQVRIMTWLCNREHELVCLRNS